METLKKTIEELSTELRGRMATYEGIQKGGSAASVSDFPAFKSFVLHSLSSLQKQVDLLARDMDRQEMRSRRKMLLVHGVKEAKDEDTTDAVLRVAAVNLKLTNMAKTNITRSHRMGRLGGDKPRPIVVKFSDMMVRDKVWFAKTNLKGSGITLSEFLTRPRHELFMAARQRFGVTKCWTREGNVFVAKPDGSRKQVVSFDDLGTAAQAGASDTAAPAGGGAPAPMAAPVTDQAQDKARRRPAAKK